MRLRDRVRVEVAVQRLGWWLDWKLTPGRRRREIIRELRASLADAAAADDLEAALDRIGHPHAMAESYGEGSPTGVRWRAGWVAATAAYVLVAWLVLAAGIGFAEGVQAAGPEPGTTYETGHSLVPGDRPLLAFQESAAGLSATFALLSWPQLAAMALAFLAFSRPWRALVPGRAQAQRR